MAPTHRLTGRPMAALIAPGLLLLGIATVSGCGSSPTRPADTVYLEEDEPSEAQRYMPLEEGTVYAYDTKTGEIDLLVGGRTEHLAAHADGIRYASGGYYLKSPLLPENVWEGRFGVVH